MKSAGKRSKTNKHAALPLTSTDLCETMPAADQAAIRDLLTRIVNRWGLWALSELTAEGPLRFSRLLERVEGVSQKSLTATLRELERDGFVTRKVTTQVPIRVDYAATSLGHALISQIHPLWLWVAENLGVFGKAHANYDRRQAKVPTKVGKPGSRDES